MDKLIDGSKRMHTKITSISSWCSSSTLGIVAARTWTNVLDALPHVTRSSHGEEVPRSRHHRHSQPVSSLERMPPDEDQVCLGRGGHQSTPAGLRGQPVCPCWRGAWRWRGAHRHALLASKGAKGESIQHLGWEDRILETHLKISIFCSYETKLTYARRLLPCRPCSIAFRSKVAIYTTIRVNILLWNSFTYTSTLFYSW